jgi:hypothetical protein
LRVKSILLRVRIILVCVKIKLSLCQPYTACWNNTRIYQNKTLPCLCYTLCIILCIKITPACLKYTKRIQITFISVKTTLYLLKSYLCVSKSDFSRQNHALPINITFSVKIKLVRAENKHSVFESHSCVWKSHFACWKNTWACAKKTFACQSHKLCLQNTLCVSKSHFTHENHLLLWLYYLCLSTTHTAS